MSIVEPGPYKTPIWRKSMGSLQAPPPGSPYSSLFERIKPMVERSAATGGDPDKVARTICRALSDAKPKLRYLPGAGERTALAAKRMLPWRFIERAVLRMLGVKR